MMFLDDIVSFGDNLEHQIENLRTVFSKLRKGNMKLNIKKCDLLSKSCVLLGHRITPEGIFPDESKFDSIKNFPQPKCRKDGMW